MSITQQEIDDAIVNALKVRENLIRAMSNKTFKENTIDSYNAVNAAIASLELESVLYKAKDGYDYIIYNGEKVSNILDIGDSYQEIAKAEIINTSPGTYMFGFAVQATLADVNDKAYLRYRHNGYQGFDWTEINKTPTKVDDVFIWTYFYPKTFSTTITVEFEIEAKKSVGGAQFDIQYADVFLYKVTNELIY